MTKFQFQPRRIEQREEERKVHEEKKRKQEEEKIERFKTLIGSYQTLNKFIEKEVYCHFQKEDIKQIKFRGLSKLLNTEKIFEVSFRYSIGSGSAYRLKIDQSYEKEFRDAYIRYYINYDSIDFASNFDSSNFNFQTDLLDDQEIFYKRLKKFLISSMTHAAHSLEYMK